MHTFRKNAFTLVEMLVVIGIIAILISIIIPVLSKGRGRAQAVKCASNIRQCVHMLNMYVNDHDGKYPQFYSLSNPFSWSDYLMPYTINVKTTADDGSNDKGRRRDPTSIYNCPSVAYDANSQLAPYGKDYASTLGYTFAVSAARWRYVRGRVPAASETILVGDMEATDDDRIASYDGYRLDTSASAPFSETFTSYADGLVAPRHEKLANMGFVDGHSEAMEPTNLLYTSSKWIWYTP